MVWKVYINTKRRFTSLASAFGLAELARKHWQKLLLTLVWLDSVKFVSLLFWGEDEVSMRIPISEVTWRGSWTDRGQAWKTTSDPFSSSSWLSWCTKENYFPRAGRTSTAACRAAKKSESSPPKPASPWPPLPTPPSLPSELKSSHLAQLPWQLWFDSHSSVQDLPLVAADLRLRNAILAQASGLLLPILLRFCTYEPWAFELNFPMGVFQVLAGPWEPEFTGAIFYGLAR